MAEATEYTKKKECEVKAIPLEKKKQMVKSGEAHWFFPHHITEQVVQCILVTLLILVLAVFFPAHLGSKADPFDTPLHIKPEWYFLSGYYVLRIAQYTDFMGAWAPKVMGIVGQAIPMIILFIIPLLDRGGIETRHPRKRKLIVTIFILGIIGFVVMTVLGHYI